MQSGASLQSSRLPCAGMQAVAGARVTLKQVLECWVPCNRDANTCSCRPASRRCSGKSYFLLLCAKHCSPEEVQASYMPVAPHSKVCGWGSTAQGEQQPL